MRKLALVLAVVFVLPFFASCKKSSKNLSPVRTVAEDSPWWDASVTTVTPEEIKASRDGDFQDVFVSYTAPDEDSVVLFFSMWSTDLEYVQIIRHYSYDGELLGEVVVNDCFGEEDYEFESQVFTLGEKYYAKIRQFDEAQDTYVELAYEIDFSGGTLKDPVTLRFPEDMNQYGSAVSDMIGVGDNLVYLVSLWDEGHALFHFYVDDGDDFRKFTPDFGKDVELTSISNLMCHGDSLSFIAQGLENTVVRTWLCTLDIHSFDLTKTPLEMQDDFWMEFIHPDGSIYKNEESLISKTDLATGNKTEILRFCNSYLFDDYYDATILWATDDKVVLLTNRQNGVGGDATAGLITFKKAEKNPNAGRKIITLAYLDRLFNNEYVAINQFNTTSEEYLIESTDKYYLIAEGAENGESDNMLADMLAGQADAVDLLISDIRSGNGPDLVIFESDCEKLNNPDYMLDLTKRIDAEESLHSGDYMDFVLAPNGRDGKHYRLDYTYIFKGLLVNKNYLDEGAKGLTFEQYDHLISEKNMGMSVLYEDELYLMQELIRTSDYFSYDESGKFSLDTEGFRTMATYIASIPENTPHDDGLTHLGSIEILPYMRAIELANQYGAQYENWSIVGFPSSDGHAEAIFGTGIGITACSPHQDAAWSFAMTLLSPESQRSLWSDPVMKSALRDNLIEYIRLYNEQLLVMPYLDPIPEETADWYISQLSDAVVVPDIHPKILMILCEEMPAYFAGDKTLDEVIGIIENRVNLMLREQG